MQRNQERFSTMRRVVVAVSLLGMVSFGCADKDRSADASQQDDEVNPWDKDAFTPEGEIHVMDRFAEAQSARGAAADKMLYARHFDGPNLNTLGTSKLSLMLKKNPVGQPMVVYLNTGDGDLHADVRRGAIEQFVAASEYTATALDLRTGPNDGSRHPAAAGLASLPKTDTAKNTNAGTSGQNRGGSTSGSGSGAGGGSGGSSQ